MRPRRLQSRLLLPLAAGRAMAIVPRRGGGCVLVAAALLAAAQARPALAGPENPHVVAGSATIQQQGNSWSITASNNAIINYNAFDIAGHERVEFIQPGADARVLNRIVGEAPTRIDGTLLANGRVYFVNPAGVIFGAGSVINVGGIVAAAANLSNEDFLAGRDRFTNVSGDVVNHGLITAQNDGASTVLGTSPAVALIGRHAANYGSIVSPQGTIVMASGDEVYLGSRESSIMVRVGEQGSAAPQGSGVLNAGEIRAARGRVTLAAGDIYGMAVVNTGRIAAPQIDFDGGTQGDVTVSGSLNADAIEASGRGGEINVTGRNVALQGAELSADGPSGGGTIRVGGGLQNDRLASGDLARTASGVWIDSGSTLSTNGTQSGDGGVISLYASQSLRSGGRLASLGGALAGHGGFIETSGGWLSLSGSPDTSASSGSGGGLGGSWLIDPLDIDIVATPSGNISGGPIFTPTAGPSTLFVGDLRDAMSTNASVSVVTTGTVGPGTGRIRLLTTLDINGLGADRALTLDAAGDIEILSRITDSDESTIDGLHLSLLTPADVRVAGGLDLMLGAGGLTVNADDMTSDNALIRAGARGVDISATGDVILGPVSITGVAPGSNALTVNAESFQSTGVISGGGGDLVLNVNDGFSIGSSFFTLGGNIRLTSGSFAQIDASLEADSIQVFADEELNLDADARATSGLLLHGGLSGTGQVRIGLTFGGSPLNLRGSSVVIRSGDGFSAGAISFGRRSSISGPVLLDAGSGLLEVGAFSAMSLITPGADLSIFAGDLSLSSGVSGSGRLFLRTFEGNTITLGAVAPAGMSITASEFGRLRDGFAEMVIDKSGQSGDIVVGGALGVRDDLRLIAGSGSIVLGASLLGQSHTLRLDGPIVVSAPGVRVEAGDLFAMGTIDAAAADAGLGLIATRSLTLGGNIGVNAPLRSFFIRSASPVDFGGTIRASAGGLVLIDSIFRLTSDTVIEGGDVVLARRVEGATSDMDLTLRAFGDAMISELASETGRLDSLLVTSGGSITLLRSVRTSGSQTYVGDTNLWGTLYESLAGGIEFEGDVELARDTIVRAGDVRFGGRVDSSLASVEPGVAFAGFLAAADAQTGGPGTDPIGAAGGGSALRRADDTTDQPFPPALASLSVESPGLTEFAGPIGSRRVLTSLGSDAPGSAVLGGDVTIALAGAVEILDNASLSGDVTIDAARILFGGSLDSAVPGAFALRTLNTDSLTIAGDAGLLGALREIDTTAIAQTSLGGSFITRDNQRYGLLRFIGLPGQRLFKSETGDLFFSSAIDADFEGLSLVADAPGLTTFASSIGAGGTFPLASLETRGGGETHLFGHVRTRFEQIFGDITRAFGGVQFRSDEGDIAFSDDLWIQNDTEIIAVDALFAGRVDSFDATQAAALRVTASGLTEFANDLGSREALALIQTDGPGFARARGVMRTTASGFIEFGEALQLTGPLELRSPTVRFLSTVDGLAPGTGSLRFVGTQLAEFLGDVGVSAALDAVDTTGSDRTRAAGSMITQNDQTHGTLVLIGVGGSGGDRVFKSLSGGLMFTSSIDAEDPGLVLIADAPGDTTFLQGVGTLRPLGGLRTLGGGRTLLHGDVLTSGDQVLSDDVRTFGDTVFNARALAPGGSVTFFGNLLLQGDATITATDATFAGGVDSFDPLAPSSLVVNALGVTDFSAGLGRASALRSIRTDTPGTTLLAGDIFLTSDGRLEFGDNAILNATPTIHSRDVFFSGNVDSGAFGTTLGFVGTQTLVILGDVGSVGALSELDLTLIPDLGLGGDVRTLGQQRYNRVKLIGTGREQTFRSEQGGLDFMGPLEAWAPGVRFVADAPGLTTFGSTIGSGGLFSLEAFATTGGGETRFLGNVRTRADQIHGDITRAFDGIEFRADAGQIRFLNDLWLQKNTNVVATSVLFGKGVDSFDDAQAVQLRVFATGLTEFAGDVGKREALALVQTDAPGLTRLRGTMRTTASGRLEFADAAELTGSLELASPTVRFLSTLNGSADATGGLSFVGTQLAEFLGDVGSSASLNTIDTTGAALTRLTGTMISQGDQAHGTLALAAGTGVGNHRIESRGGNLTFTSTIDAESPGIDLIVAGPGVALFQAAVGSATAPRSFTRTQGHTIAQADITAGDGGMTIEGSLETVGDRTLATTGDFTLLGPAQLRSALTIEAANARFGSTIDAIEEQADASLLVRSPGTTTFDGSVGSIAALRTLRTDAEGLTLVRADLTTTSSLWLADEVAIDSQGGLVTLDSGTILLGRGLRTHELAISPANLRLLARSAASADGAPIRIGGSLGDAGRALGDLSIETLLDGVPAFATILFASGFDDQGRIDADAIDTSTLFTINARSLSLARGQKLTALGALTMNIEGLAQLGDLTTLGDLTINADTIEFLSRDPAEVENNTGSRETDLGVDVVSGGRITLSTAPTFEHADPLKPLGQLVFSSPLTQNDPDLQRFVFRLYDLPLTIDLFRDQRGGVNASENAARFGLFLDLAGRGVTTIPIAETQVGLIPRLGEIRLVSRGVQISPAMREQLLELGLSVNNLTAEELAEFLVGRSFYRDLPLLANPQVDQGDYRVTANRLWLEAVERVLGTYREVMFTQVVREDGQTVAESRAEDIRDSITAAWDRYAEDGRDDIEGFIQYLAATPEEAGVVADLRGMQTLITQLKDIGLANFEVTLPTDKLMEVIRPPAVRGEEMLAIVMNPWGQTPGVLPSMPSSPPAAAPADARPADAGGTPATDQPVASR